MKPREAIQKHNIRTDNPHEVTAAQVGATTLDEVKSDADIADAISKKHAPGYNDIDGGSADSIYLPTQIIDGGNA